MNSAFKTTENMFELVMPLIKQGISGAATATGVLANLNFSNILDLLKNAKNITQSISTPTNLKLPNISAS